MEMSIILEKYCVNFIYPTPFALHFSNGHKDKYIANLENYCLTMNGVDKDLAAHFTVVREVGITLCGKDIKSVFGPVPRTDYIDSIKYDVENAVNEIEKNPVYIVLNLCRVLAYIKDGLVLSKKQGGQWGVEYLPEKYRQIIKKAKNCYFLVNNY
jgi:streptomycin 3"-adenylyltransferase